MKTLACVFLLAVILLQPQLTLAVEDGARPMIVIYSQEVLGYGEALASIIEQDDRIDAEILVLTEADLFRTVLYFPYVKVVVAVFNQHRDEGLSSDIETYFAEGGGIVGVGFAGWETTTRNASREVFYLAANVYVTGKYDRSLGAFTHNFIVDTPHEISADVGDLTLRTQRIILHRNRTTGELREPGPEDNVIVLYRDAVQNAPVVILHEENGTCVTFGGLTGDALEGVPTYFGHLTEQEEFRHLFTNAVYYVWREESRHEVTSSRAVERFQDEAAALDNVKEDAEEGRRRAESMRLIRQVLIVLIALVVCAVAYRYSFSKNHDGGA